MFCLPKTAWPPTCAGAEHRERVEGCEGRNAGRARGPGDRANLNRLKEGFNMTEPTFSIIAPIFNELDNLPELYRRVSEVMDSTGEVGS